MEKITASQLAFILDIPKKDAVKKIVVALKRKEGTERYSFSERDLSDYEKDPSIDIEYLQKRLGIDLDNAIENIRTCFLKNSSTGKWILEYPETRLKPNKDGKLPMSIGIPKALQSLLSEETKVEIINKWKERYGDFQVQFKIT